MSERATVTITCRDCQDSAHMDVDQVNRRSAALAADSLSFWLVNEHQCKPIVPRQDWPWFSTFFPVHYPSAPDSNR